MLFQALTDAPMLREGANLSFMAIPQIDGAAPASPTIRADVTVRLGYCSPQIVQGRITARDTETDRIVLTTGQRDWVLGPGSNNDENGVPGIVSEGWRVL